MISGLRVRRSAELSGKTEIVTRFYRQSRVLDGQRTKCPLGQEHAEVVATACVHINTYTYVNMDTCMYIHIHVTYMQL